MKRYTPHNLELPVPSHQIRVTSHRLPKMKDHKELDVWKTSVDLVIKIYEITRDFPKEEMYGLTSQIRRSAGSIPNRET